MTEATSTASTYAGTRGEIPNGKTTGRARAAERKPLTRRNAAWTIHAQAVIEELRSSLEPRSGDKRNHANALELLEAAEGYVAERPGLKSWIRGTRVEGAWTYIHAARVAALEHATQEELVAMVPHVEASIRSYLPKDHPSVAALAAWKAARDPSTANDAERLESDRALLCRMLSAAYRANGESYVRLRRFRNVLLSWAAFMFAIVAVMSMASAWKPSMLSMCIKPAAGTSSIPYCATRSGTASGGDVTLVAALGVVGAALASTRSLTQSTRASTVAYSLRVARALLKLAMGGVTAVVGILAVQAGAVPALGQITSSGSIRFYAVVFGGAQQLVTRLVDQQAEKALQSASTSPEEAKAAAL